MYASVNWVSIGSDNGLSPFRHQAITLTNAHHACYGEYLTIANFNVYYLLFTICADDLFSICVDEGVCVWEREFVSCYVMCFYLIVGQYLIELMFFVDS